MRSIEAISTEFGRHARADRGRKIALGERIVVAVPMQFHALARALIEDRGKVGGSDQLRVGNAAARRQLQQELIGIERVDAAGSPRRLALEQRQEARAVLDEALAHGRQHVVAPGELVEPVEARALPLHRRDQVIRRKPLVGRQIEHEANEAVEVEIVRGHAGDDVRGSVRRLAPGPDVAGSAIEPDDVDPAHLAARNADRQVERPAVGVLLILEAEGGIVAAAFELGGKEARQRLPHPIGQAAVGFGADRAIHEMGGVVAVSRGRFAAKPEQRDAAEENRGQSDQHQQGADNPDEREQPHARPERDLDGGEGRVDIAHRDITTSVGVTSPPWTR